MARGINADVCADSKWSVKERSRAPTTTGEVITVSLALPTVPAMTPADIRIASRRGAVATSVTGPASAAVNFYVWRLACCLGDPGGCGRLSYDRIYMNSR